jgi:TonB family protein
MSKMLRREFGALLLVAMLPALCPASVDTNPAPNTGGQASWAAREHRLGNTAFHDSEFATLVHTGGRTSCGAPEPPQALATPDPLLEEADLHAKISVSFIIGTDGRVHSPLILESAGPSGDRTILDAVRFWRYRPARCNGVPTDAEAKVEFSSR